MDYSEPQLVEPGVKYFLKHSLKQCRNIKDKYITVFVNILLFLLFVGILAAILFYKYKGKLTPQEKYMRENKKKQYIYTKLNQFKSQKKKTDKNMITDLPQWDNNTYNLQRKLYDKE